MRTDFGGKDKSTCRILIPSQWCTIKITVKMKQKDKNTKIILQLFFYEENNLRGKSMTDPKIHPNMNVKKIIKYNDKFFLLLFSLYIIFLL
jgi:hypothetical protein